jgi:tRNA G18 (ribose-2'-O)-methylase SpoU
LTPAARSATLEDLRIFGSLRRSQCPEGYFLGEGEKLVRRMVERGKAVKILCTPEWLEKLAVPESVEIIVAPDKALRRIVGWRFHQCVMAMGRIEIPDGPPSGTLFVALDGLSNSENVGAVLRSCAAFGVDGVIVGPETASPWLRRAVRAALGAPLDVPVHFVRDLPGTLENSTAYASCLHGERRTYHEVDFTVPCTIVLGSEESGIRPEVRSACKETIHIPMVPTWDSLNVAAAGAILLAEAARQRGRP